MPTITPIAPRADTRRTVPPRNVRAPVPPSSNEDAAVVEALAQIVADAAVRRLTEASSPAASF